MLQIKFSTGNAAFHDYETGELNTIEVIRILGTIATDIENGKTSGKAIDYNGNSVGEWKLTNR